MQLTLYKNNTKLIYYELLSFEKAAPDKNSFLSSMLGLNNISMRAASTALKGLPHQISITLK
jgi:hypothetical protein